MIRFYGAFAAIYAVVVLLLFVVNWQMQAQFGKSLPAGMAAGVYIVSVGLTGFLHGKTLRAEPASIEYWRMSVMITLIAAVVSLVYGGLLLAAAPGILTELAAIGREVGGLILALAAAFVTLIYLIAARYTLPPAIREGLKAAAK
ncbi:MAG: ABZJ_00895 family protein [Neomegalonema sp.]|nr:ABZJ_00895 family protein [Neomegalonema sp.]